MISMTYFKSVSLLVVLSLLVLMPLKIWSQGQVGATIKDNKLEDSRNLTITATIIGLEVYNPNLNFFIEGKLLYRFKKELGWIKANYSLAYGDRIGQVIESSSSQEAIPANGTQPLRNIGGSIGFNFKRKEVYKVARASFFQKRKTVDLRIKSYRLYGVHIGYESFRTIFAQGSTTSYTGTIHQGLPHDTSVITSDATPMFRMGIVSLGIHRQLVDHYEIEVSNGSGTAVYTNKSCSMVYADFLFGVNMTFDDLLIPLNGNGPNSNPQPYGNLGGNDPFNFYQANINGSYKKIPVGARIGWELTGLKSVGYMVGVEAGFRPGIMDPLYNLYFSVKVGITFNIKAK